MKEETNPWHSSERVQKGKTPCSATSTDSMPPKLFNKLFFIIISDYSFILHNVIYIKLICKNISHVLSVIR